MLTPIWMEDVAELQAFFALVPNNSYHGFELQCRMCRQRFFATDNLSVLVMHQWAAREDHKKFSGEPSTISLSKLKGQHV